MNHYSELLNKIIPSLILHVKTAMEESQSKDEEIEERKKQISKSAMRIVRYNKLLQDLKSDIEKLEWEDKKNLSGIISKIKQVWDKEADWESLEPLLDVIHTDFFKNIYKAYPNLTQSELRHLAYIRMNLSNTEVAGLMRVKIESLRALRYRLKKKLSLTEGLDLRDFIAQY